MEQSQATTVELSQLKTGQPEESEAKPQILSRDAQIRKIIQVCMQGA
jgi:hypothetical protein